MNLAFSRFKNVINAYPRPAQLLGLVVVLYGLRLVVLAPFPRSIRTTPLVAYGSLAIVYLCFIIVVGLVARRDPAFRYKVGLVWGGGRLAAGLSLGLGALATAVVLFQGGRSLLRLPGNGWEIWAVALIGAVVVVPLVEEFIFRGLLLAYLLDWLPRRLPNLRWPIERVALGLSALAFSLAHLGASVLFLLALFIGGLLYGWVRLRSGSLCPSIAGHATWNGIIMLGQLLN